MRNSPELSNYFSLINKYVDDYLKRWNENVTKFGRENKVTASELKRYLSPERVKIFLMKHGLTDIPKIEKVLEEVLADLENAERDGVEIKTFESFLESYSESDLNEQSLMTGLDGAGLEHEKVLADYFDVSLSAIDCVNNVGHQFKINAPGAEKECVIILSNEIGPVKENLLKLVRSKLSVMYVGINLSETTVDIPLKNILSDEKLRDKIEMIDGENLDSWIGVILGGKTERDGDHRIVIL